MLYEVITVNPVFGCISAGMSWFFLVKNVHFLWILDNLLGGYAPDYPSCQGNISLNYIYHTKQSTTGRQDCYMGIQLVITSYSIHYTKLYDIENTNIIKHFTSILKRISRFYDFRCTNFFQFIFSNPPSLHIIPAMPFPVQLYCTLISYPFPKLVLILV